ncbi:BTAD domain-containing putative transcriptional regulator [Actinopolymorpha pittospori]|uniref:ATPase/DNA-binding SARP family transcriptional activator n=1 Tax=Actinopolymorpha pittospori TaxID=648752 RepID=A0A927MRI0_9ACTN|nr:putative ATPase/DNA-binding SARP family transcriptional activator [Actinopolymorpha pittospori]
MRVRVLGPLELRDEQGRSVEVGGSRLRALLIRLALQAHAVVTVEALIDGLWGDEAPSGAVNALQSLVSRLRRALPSDGSVQVQSHPSGYRLLVDPDQVDVHRFERLAADGRATLAAGRPEEASAVLHEAEALWRGPALADATDAPFAEAAGVRLDGLRLAATEDRLEADLACGRQAEVLPVLERLAAAHPLRERLQGQLMRALYAAGRQADALVAYERVRTALADQLGVDPGTELAEVHLALLRQDPDLRPAVLAAASQEPRSNLRTPLTSFVGREAELRSLGKILAEERLVTVVGPGGAGKTRLASELAGGSESRRTHETWFVELAAIADPAQVPQAVLSAVGVRDVALLETNQLESPSLRDPITRLVETFGSRKTLLILDNCEHLVAAAADLADQLLGACPELRVLATSRELLGVPGERLYPIPPLGLPPDPSGEGEPAPDPHVGAPASGPTCFDPSAALAYPAVRLFADRAVAVRPDFKVSAENVDAVVEICRRLDGLPLAIELAAARLRSLSVTQIADRLDDRFRLLTAGRRTVLPRHQTLRAVVEWSWDLLEEPERVLLRRLSVFHGGATLELAEEICSDDQLPREGVLDVLAALVDKSLVEAVVDDAGEARYRLLETVRAYGQERIAEAGERVAVMTAHARCFTRYAETASVQLRGPNQLVWLARLRAEHQNVVAAIRTSVEIQSADLAVRLVAAFSWFWFLQGHRSESASWTRVALAVPGESPPAQRALVMMLAGMGSFALGEYEEGGKLLGEAGSLAQAEGTRIRQDYPDLALLEAMTPAFRNDPAAARERLAEIFPTLTPWAQAVAMMFRGHIEENAGNAEGHEKDIAGALERFAVVGDRWGRAAALRSLSGIRSLAGDHAAAIAAQEEALTLVQELGSQDDVPQMLTHIASERARSGDLDGARADLDRAQAMVDQGRAPEMSAWVQLGRSEVAARSGDLREARRLLDLAQDAVQFARPPQLRALLLAVVASAAVADNDPQAARTALTEAIRIGPTTQDMPILALIVQSLAGLVLTEGDPERAAVLNGAATALRGAPDRSGSDVVVRTEARAREALGDPAYEEAYARGLALSRDEAVALLREFAEPES